MAHKLKGTAPLVLRAGIECGQDLLITALRGLDNAELFPDLHECGHSSVDVRRLVGSAELHPDARLSLGYHRIAESHLSCWILGLCWAESEAALLSVFWLGNGGL